MAQGHKKAKEDAGSTAKYSPLDPHSHQHHPPSTLIQAAVQQAIMKNHDLMNSMNLLLILTIGLAITLVVAILYIKVNDDE